MEWNIKAKKMIQAWSEKMQKKKTSRLPGKGINSEGLVHTELLHCFPSPVENLKA